MFNVIVKSFQENSALIMTAVQSTDFNSGNVIRKKSFHHPAPSIIAASSNSMGTVFTKLVNSRILKEMPLNAARTMTAPMYVFKKTRLF